jgi:hypothetical protein
MAQVGRSHGIKFSFSIVKVVMAEMVVELKMASKGDREHEAGMPANIETLK